MILKLPWPPSANHYWRHTNIGGHYISKQGKDYRMLVLIAARKAGVRTPNLDRLRVEITATMPDARRRDLDNLLKSLLDAMQHAGCYHDDEQIDELVIRRGSRKKPGGVVVEIESLMGMSHREAMGEDV